MKYFNLFVVMVMLCVLQWNVVDAAKKVEVNFASDAGKLNLYNKNGNIKKITKCRLNLTNKEVICHAYYEKTVKTCDNDPMYCSAKYFMDYDLHIPITKYTGSSCTLTNGTTFKSSKLMAQSVNKKTNKTQWSQVQSLANYGLIIDTDGTPVLRKTLNYSSSKQRFDFITSNGCKFSAHYDKITTTITNVAAVA